MIITTTENIPEKNYEILGMVKGGMVQTKNIAKDFGQGLKSIVGGELKSYGIMMDEARATATHRMVQEAEKLNADAIVCTRYGSSMIAAGAAEILAYGTAVKFV